MMHRGPRKRPVDYILPFLIMICAGIIVVLGYQLFSSMNQTDTDKDIYMYVAKGSTKILPWGAGEWERGYNGMRLLQGDSVKTQAGSRLVVELFNDHYVRVDENTELNIHDIKKSGNAYEINLVLRQGSIWINNDENSETPVKFNVRTDHTVVKTISTIYEVEQKDTSEAVRVVKGSIVADVMIEENGELNQVESLQIGVGQQAIITDDDIKDYTDRKSPSVIEAIDDNFRDSGFYKWNMAEDNSPTDFSTKSNTLDDTFFDNETSDTTTAESDLPAPEITTPSTLNFETSEDSLTIRGTTSFDTQKMMVDVVSGGTEETYELNLYVPGGTEWSFAVGVDADTLNPGINTYEFYAVDSNELNSKKTKLTVDFGGEDSVNADEANNPDDTTETDEEADTTNLDLGALVAPTVDTYNGGSSNEVDTSEVRIVGSVAGAEKVIVDGYTLQAFEAGDTTWSYFAKESLGNLDPGENTYEVEAVAPDGSTKSTQFTIIYNKTTEEEPVVDEPATEEPAAT